MRVRWRCAVTYQIVTGMLYNPGQVEHQELERVSMSLWYFVHSGKQSFALCNIVFELCLSVSIGGDTRRFLSTYDPPPRIDHKRHR